MFTFGTKLTLGKKKEKSPLSFPAATSSTNGHPLTGTFHLLTGTNTDEFLVSAGGDNLDWASP